MEIIWESSQKSVLFENDLSVSKATTQSDLNHNGEKK